MKIKNSLCLALTLSIGLASAQVPGQTFSFSTIAGGAEGSNDGVGTMAQFDEPSGVAVDAAGNVYVADQANNAIREIMPYGTNWIVTTIAGGTRGTNDGTNGQAQFSGPSGITVDSGTNLYVADQFNYTIRKISLQGTNWVVTTIAGQAGVAGTNGGVGTNAQFHNPAGIAVDASNNLFIADEFNNAIREVVSNGSGWTVSTIAGGVTNGFANGTNGQAEFYDPSGVAVDSNDNVFVADQFNNSIRLAAPEGSNWVVSTIAGQTIAGFSNGVGSVALFTAPVGVAVDSNDNVYVADEFNNAIRELVYTNSNWNVSTIGGGTRGFQDGAGTNAEFYLPFDVAADNYGNIYVADFHNNAIREGVSSEAVPAVGSLTVTITPSNAVTGGAQFSLDGGTLQASGTTLTNLTPGNHDLVFNNVSGFTTPAPQTVVITAHQATAATGIYAVAIANAGSLQVLISPDEAVDEGAEWQVDNGSLQTNGAIVSGLSVGAHTLSFTSVSGFVRPANQTVQITNGETTLGLGTYVSASGGIQVTIEPTNIANQAQWQVDGGALQNSGVTLSGLSAGQHTVSFSFVTGYVTPPNQTVTVQSGAVSQLTVTYTVAPIFTVTVNAFPSVGGTVTGGGTNQEDATNILTATPNSGYVFVAWGGDATGTNPTNAVEVTTNLSITAYFAPVGTPTLYLLSSGDGTVGPSLNGGAAARLNVSYAFRATAHSGSVFAGWSGSLETTKNPLAIKFTSNMVLEANFVPNPFVPYAGVYNGLFASPNGVTVQTAGMLKTFTVRTTGAYSGTLVLAGMDHLLSGMFDAGGQSSNLIKQALNLGGPLSVSLTLQTTSNYGPQVIGSVSGTNGTAWTSELSADLATNTRSSAKYTMVIPPDTNNAPPTTSPGGEGYASITTTAGTAHIAGALADGTALSEAVTESQTGYVPVYESLYDRQGLILGWINLNSTNAPGVSLTWIHPALSKGLYQGAFTNVLYTNQILISPWTPAPTGLVTLTNIAISSTPFNTNVANTAIVTSSKGVITVNSKPAGAINPSTGVFRVTLGTGSSRIVGNGAILLNSTNGGGYILSSNSQTIQIQ